MEDVGVFAVEAECIAENVLEAVNEKTSEVTKKNFPYAETNISMHSNAKNKFLEALDKE